MSAREVPGLAKRSALDLTPDPERVVTRLFVAGIELEGGGQSRASNVVTRLLELSDQEVADHVEDLRGRFSRRHADMFDVFVHHADRIANRLAPDVVLSIDRLRLLGAMFTHEFSVEAAALCNPSIVAHPDQRDTAPGDVRVVMSVRGIGEGHRSSIGFRTGTIHANGSTTIERPATDLVLGTPTPSLIEGPILRRALRDAGHGDESTDFVLDQLGDRFTFEEFTVLLEDLFTQSDTRRNVQASIDRMLRLARSSYSATFDSGTELSARVLWPHSEAEEHGMEDARFVRFEDDEGSRYYATYTAYDGRQVHQHLLETTDFVTFHMSPMAGIAARNKGLALFPRKIGGRYHALSRADRETNAVTVSDDPRCWTESTVIQSPERVWEAIQLGNCGSPLETPAGWIVLTHGVGPMRTYSIGAMLLDLDDPRKVLASLDQPLLTPTDQERDGYVPNVVYSCGGLIHDGVLVLPYGIADERISIATVDVEQLIAAMT